MNKCEVVFNMGSFHWWCNTHEMRAWTDHSCYEGERQRAEAAEARAAELTAQLATVTAERNRFADELAARGYKPRCTCTMDDNMHEPQCAITEWARLRFERTAPLDWRDAYDGETPLGIALDGLGDEVE